MDDASIDVVTVAQAFHWFDAPSALAEVARVLRPGGRLVLLWNERDESTPWVAEMSRLIAWHERTVSRYQHVSWPDDRRDLGPVPAAPRAHDRLGPADDAGPPRATRVRSISYIAAMPAPQRERLAAGVMHLARRMEEPFPMPYLCRVQWATLI